MTIMKSYVGKNTLKKLMQLILEALDQKEDLMEVITEEEVNQLWNDIEV